MNQVTHKIITVSQMSARGFKWLQNTERESSQFLEAQVRLTIYNFLRGHMGIQVTSFPITRSGIIGFPCRERSLYFHFSCLGYQWLQSIYTHVSFSSEIKMSVLKSLYRGVGRSSGSQVLTKIKWGCMKKIQSMLLNQSPHKSLE